jgi:hypothetical protein
MMTHSSKLKKASLLGNQVTYVEKSAKCGCPKMSGQLDIKSYQTLSLFYAILDI